MNFYNELGIKLILSFSSMELFELLSFTLQFPNHYFLIFTLFLFKFLPILDPHLRLNQLVFVPLLLEYFPFQDLL